MWFLFNGLVSFNFNVNVIHIFRDGMWKRSCQGVQFEISFVPLADASAGR